MTKDNYIEVSKAKRMIAQLSNGKRQRILALLEEHSEMSVSEIYTTLNMPQSEVSVLITPLRRAKIVNVRNEGKRAYYSVNTAKIQAILNGVKIMNG